MSRRVGEIVPALTARLSAAGCAEARLDARLLVAGALDIPPMTVFSRPERELTPEEEARLDVMASQREARQPMAQILGRRDFWTMTFAVSPATLDPRPDSETLIEAAMELFPDRSAPLRVLDLGTGTGCLLLSVLSEYPQATGLGIDLSPEALAVANRNLQTLGFAGRAQMRPGNWYDGITDRFDLVLSNPPYIPAGDIAGLEPEVRQWEPLSALVGGEDGLDCYRLLAAGVGGVLKPGGVVLWEVGAGQAASAGALLAKAGLTVLEPRRDLGGIDRCVRALCAAQ